MSEPFLGEIRMLAGDFVPRGWAPCDGRTLAIADHPPLYSVLGTAWGGDGVETFALPDLRRTVAARGEREPAFIIALAGVYPARGRG